MTGLPDAAPRLVRDLMTVGVPTCPPNTPAVEVARLILENGFEAVVVLDGSEGHAIGVVSQVELVEAYGKGIVSDLTAEDVMQAGVPQIPPDIPLAAAAQIMLDRSVRALFLMHNAGGIIYPAAMITYRHILRHLAARDETDLRDLGIWADRQSPLDAFRQRRDSARTNRTPG